MKASTLKYAVLSWVSAFATLIILLLPFHAFLTVWGSTIVGHYTGLRLWKEVLLAICITGVLFLLIADRKIRSHTLSRRLVWLILAYAALVLVWGFLAWSSKEVAAKAVGYGLIVDLRFLAFFLVTWALALRLARMNSRGQWMIYLPAIVVVVVGLLQAFIMPHDFMKHFGYSDLTIPAYETINNNDQYYRISSTLRGANPLGAYLLIPISLLVVLMLRGQRHWRDVAFLVASFVVLFFSFSRSAWLGTALAIGCILLVSIRSRRMARWAAGITGGLIAAGVLLTIALWQNAYFQNLVFHTEDRSTVAVSSNDARSEALRSGLSDMASDPLGDGPGTAGPASVYNHGNVRISENYFIQVGREVGWLGLLLFVLINAGVAYLLWLRRADPLALSLLASLAGLTLVNLLSHAWADDTLAYIWWGLAGIAMAHLPRQSGEQIDEQKAK